MASDRWLFMLSLDDIDYVRKYVGEFIEDCITLISRSAHHGAPPSEMYLRSWLPAQMAELQRAEEQVRRERQISNLSSACGFCSA
ncbi:hypothetical protein EBR21_17955 [bacterium]|nr:hypothetical protein [bacterium]